MDLTEIGLTANEARVYESLLNLGKTTAAQICKDARVPYGRIYNILASLELKGLVKTIPEATKKFVPSDPKAIELYIAEKRKKLDEAEKKIKEYKIIYEEHEKEAVQLAQGTHTFYKIFNAMKPAETYAYSIKYNFDTHPSIIRDLKRIRANKIEYKVLGRVDKETKDNIKFLNKYHQIVKPISNEGVAISIVDDQEMFICLIKSNTTMLIKDVPFIKLMKELFINYYEHQKPIK
jgi:sugar-specific transcriptional regulator TrmB